MNCRDDLRVAAMLLTRLPVGRVARTVPMGATGWAWPLVGAGVGAAQALALWAGGALGLPPLAAAVIAVAVGLGVTGALHEDGLADLADGVGGGATPARKLEIMRDSRLGTFGAAALCLALILRVVCFAALIAVPWVLVAAGAASRGLLPLLQWQQPAARPGLGARAAEGGTAAICLIALGLGTVALIPVGGVLPLIAAQAGVAALAHRQIGGINGDVLGAAQVVGEAAILLAVLSAL
ncbi:adenosylcobinamide-GDP ribazoletransferase [Falsirhodobacter halotolerans]|uniref:adenosylcobinamide-GDP ribazoletransferase n=1 Tax=Falsirhodobacter halotolerans TaxID=1146892 RepID=UPI001FD28C27|nr:adenosylcobinamide-GDP ribazoletransferase [Falsirhodobacter halotolerans]MCJ8139032.1 adenosylcobinamide-GDP ribazoletransferase [Falsirhodobacter halotolerans]